MTITKKGGNGGTEKYPKICVAEKTGQWLDRLGPDDVAKNESIRKSEYVGETHTDEVNGRHGTLGRNGNFYETDRK